MSENGKLSQILGAELDRLNVPEGDVRELVRMLGRMMDAPERSAGQLLAMKAWEGMWGLLTELHEPRTPLQEQLAYERARRELAAMGHDLRSWDDLPADQRYGLGDAPQAD